MKRKKKTLILLILSISIISILSIQFISFSSYGPVGDTTNIAAGDFIKNFRFDTIGNEPIIDRGAYDNKLRFEMQETWELNRDTILNMADTHSVPREDGGYDVYLRFKIEARTRVNIYTYLLINQVSESFYDLEEEFSAGTYKHRGCFGDVVYSRFGYRTDCTI